MEQEKLYYSIGEVAARFKINESTLRFWEKEFPNIAPRKNKAGARFYKEEDIKKVSLIYHLLKERGMTIAGARKKMKENKDLTEKNYEIVEKLKEIKAELKGIIDEMD